MVVLPRPDLSVFYQRPQVPLTACIVLAFRVAAPLALCPRSGQVYWDVSCVPVKKDGVPSGLERGWRKGCTLDLVLQPLSASTLDTKAAAGNLRMGGGFHPRPTSKLAAPGKAQK